MFPVRRRITGARAFTKVPFPGRVSSTPCAASSARARRTVTRLSPKNSTSSRSEGRLSPGLSRPDWISEMTCSVIWVNTP